MQLLTHFQFVKLKDRQHNYLSSLSKFENSSAIPLWYASAIILGQSNASAVILIFIIRKSEDETH